MNQDQTRLARLIGPVNLPPYEEVAGRLRRFSAPRHKTRLINETEREWARWIHSTAKWTMMVTLTFRRKGGKGFQVTQTAIERALRHLLRLINCDLFTRRRVDRGWTIAYAVTVDYGAYGDHPHAHLLLAAPEGVSEEQLCKVVERAVHRTSLVDRQRDYGQYYSTGGAEYLIKHGTDRMVVSLLTPSVSRHLSQPPKNAVVLWGATG